jgi:hypothetical protein
MHMKKRKETLKNQFEFFSRMVSWLDSCFTRSGRLDRCQGLLVKMFRILRTRGKPEAIKYVKKTRQALLKVLGCHSYQQLVTKTKLVRFPKDLRFLKNVDADKFYPLLRLTLSTLSSFRFLKGDGVPSFKTIEEGPYYKGDPFGLVGHVLPFLRSLGLNPRFLGSRSKQLDFKKFRLTTKAGPKGHALWTSYLDLLSLPKPLYEAIGRVGGSRLQEVMSNYLVFIPYLRRYFEARSVKTGTALRRLSVICDKEGKNREIAILDYYSQAALQPLHKYLFRLLSRIPQDCTFDHSKHLATITPSKGSQFHSIDLSSATDRFPIKVQSMVLGVMFGEDFVRDWETIMVGYPFEYQGRAISYARGNPMGAYSSWSSFSLSHHFLVYYACNCAGIPWKSCPYMLLGDDIVIANDAVAGHYKRVLEGLDIPFSAEKSHSSTYLFEFSKRFVHDGTEVSPFPLAGLYENRNHWLLALGTIFEEVHRKRWNMYVDVTSCCLEFLKYLGRNSRFIEKRGPKIRLILAIRSFFSQSMPVADVLRHAALMVGGERLVSQVEMFPFYNEQRFLIPSLTRMFLKDLDRITDPVNSKPLGQLAEDIVMIGSGLFEQVEDPFQLIHSCPITRTYGEVEEIYLRLRNKPYDGAALLEGRVRDFIFSGSVPASDDVFFTRRKDVMILASSRLADELLVTLAEFRDQSPISCGDELHFDEDSGSAWLGGALLSEYGDQLPPGADPTGLGFLD